MKKRIRAIEPIKLEFEDGTTKDLIFNAVSAAILDEEFEGTFKIIRNLGIKPYEASSKILYAGIKALDDSYTYEEAKALTVQMPMDILIELSNEFINGLTSSTIAATDAEKEALAKKLMKEFFQK